MFILSITYFIFLQTADLEHKTDTSLFVIYNLPNNKRENTKNILYSIYELNKTERNRQNKRKSKSYIR